MLQREVIDHGQVQMADILQPVAASPHIMLSYQWEYQAMMARINDSMKRRGYLTWIDLDQQQTQETPDERLLLNEAISGAAVVCVGVCRGYKESANCRLEAKLCVQQEKELIPLMLEQTMPEGWLGLLLGSRKGYSFWGPELDESVLGDRAFEA